MVVPGLVVDQCVLAEHVGDGVEVLLLAERQLERPQMVAERGAQIGEDTPEVRSRPVLLRDDHDARHARRLGRAPTPHACPRVTPSTALTTTSGDIRHGQRGVDAAHEVGVAGCVDERDRALGAVFLFQVR